MNGREIANWITRTPGRLTGTASVVGTVFAVAMVIVLAGRMGGWVHAASGLKPTAAPTTYAQQTVTLPSYVRVPVTLPPVDTTVQDSSRAARDAATAAMTAWLAGDLTLGGLAHPSLVVPPPTPGDRMLGPPGVLDVYPEAGLASVSVSVTSARVVLGMLLTDEVGWIVNGMAVTPL